MPTTLKSYQTERLLTLLDMSLKENKINLNNPLSCGAIDHFKDMNALHENVCKKITGWTKLQFSNFAKLITTVKDTNGRTKEQLIAIYRYWLSKGLDQCTLALLKSNTTQQQISHLSAQIKLQLIMNLFQNILGQIKEETFSFS